MRSIQFHYFLFSFNEKLPRLRITMVKLIQAFEITTPPPGN